MSRALARNSDPATSHRAAARVTHKVSKLESAVFRVLKKSKIDLTVREISEISGIDKWSVSPRMVPLELKGLIERADTRGRAICWRAK